MIELNLLPEELKQKKKEIKLPSIPMLHVLIGLLSVLVFIHVVLLGLVQINKNKISIYNKQWEVLEPKRKKVQELKGETENTERKVKLLESLIENRILWAEKLNALSDSLPPNIWFTELSFRKAPSQKLKERIPGIVPGIALQGAGPELGNLSLKGYATGKTEEATASIGRFIKALEENKHFTKDFQEIELGSIRRNLFNSIEVMDFSLTCAFKEEGLGNKKNLKEDK